METTLRIALGRQFGTAIDVFEEAVVACPPALWTQPLWRDPPDQPRSPWIPPEFAEFWYVTYHTIFWLDLYLSGDPEEAFVPPAPFTRAAPELDLDGVRPARPYTKEELRGYLAVMRDKCQATVAGLTDAQARRIVDYPWAEGKDVSFLELLLYTMRHVQEHAAQLSLFLSQQAVPDSRF
jgi:hypothetical protein